MINFDTKKTSPQIKNKEENNVQLNSNIIFTKDLR